jgi:hypothetical protein
MLIIELFIVYIYIGVSMLRLVDLRVPTHTIRGQPVRLECHYDLEGEALYSVKWYKVSKSTANRGQVD